MLYYLKYVYILNLFWMQNIILYFINKIYVTMFLWQSVVEQQLA